MTDKNYSSKKTVNSPCVAFIWHLAQVTVPESDQTAGIEASSSPDVHPNFTETDWPSSHSSPAPQFTSSLWSRATLLVVKLLLILQVIIFFPF